LIKRTKSNIELTSEGKIVFSYAEKIFSIVRDLESNLEDFNSLKAGKLKIGSTPTLARYILPDIIVSLKKRNPDLKVQLYTGLSKEVLGKVIDFEYHIGIIGRVAYPGNIICKKISNPRLYLITSDDMNASIPLKNLSNYPLLFPEQGSATREYIINEFKKRSIPLNKYIDCENPSALKHMVHLGTGGAFLPSYSIEKDVREGKYKRIEILDNLSMTIDLVYLKERKKSQPIKTFLNVIKGLAPPGVQANPD
ncbi:MAG: hypothetical protein JRE58_10610, partial [Deltaproteobacteria bacterium]|nr:hypothetical protein [Deltaproteobacteria bacterium]